MKKRKINYEEKKYNILKILRKNNSYEEYSLIIDKAPKLLGISERTWKYWIYLSKNEKTEIPYTYLKRISVLLDTDIESLINFEIKIYEKK